MQFFSSALKIPMSCRPFQIADTSIPSVVKGFFFIYQIFHLIEQNVGIVTIPRRYIDWLTSIRCGYAMQIFYNINNFFSGCRCCFCFAYTNVLILLFVIDKKKKVPDIWCIQRRSVLVCAQSIYQIKLSIGVNINVVHVIKSITLHYIASKIAHWFWLI